MSAGYAVEPPSDFKKLLDEEHDRLLSFLFFTLADLEEAESITEKAFTLLLGDWYLPGVRSRPAVHLYRQAYLETLRRMPRSAPGRRLPPAGSEELARALTVLRGGDLEEAARNEAWVILAAALASLSREEREVFLLRDYLGFSEEDVGEILWLKPTKVRALLGRARKTLREKATPLAPESGEE